MNEIILIGGGGHCKSVIDVIETQGKYKIAGVVDRVERIGGKVLGYKIIGTDGEIHTIARDYQYFLITIGQIHPNNLRFELFQKIKEAGGKLPAICSPLAYVSKHAEIGEGSIVMHYAMVNAGARVGKNCIINSRALVEHDSTVGNHSHIATGALINGECEVGSFSFVGSGTTLIQGKNIGDNVMIGAGSLLTKNVIESGTYYGIPARKIN